MYLGLDLDGVVRKCDMAALRSMHGICGLQTKLTKLNPEIKLDLAIYAWHYGCEEGPQLMPQDLMAEGDKCIILTAQPTYAVDMTKKWLEKYLPNIPYEMESFEPVDHSQWDKLATNGKSVTTRDWAKWKAERILALGIEVYIDDGPDVVAGLRKFVGDKCKVLQYGGRMV